MTYRLLGLLLITTACLLAWVAGPSEGSLGLIRWLERKLT